MLRQCGIFLLLVAFFVLALPLSAMEIEKASGKALGVTKGKSFSAGYVFVDGRYIPPPYVVERWGVGIRINSIPVVESVIDWSAFLKTQSGVKVTKSETPAEAPVEEPEAEVEEEEDDSSSDSSLDDLFDDEPKPKKTPKKKKTVRRAPRKPTTSVSYSLDGDFVPNDASKALVQRINKTRTEINTILIKGGFICFGSKYSRAAGDARAAEELMERLPEIEHKCTTAEAFVSAVRAANLVYLTEPICLDLFQNRRDYIRLAERRKKDRSERELKKLLNNL